MLAVSNLHISSIRYTTAVNLLCGKYGNTSMVLSRHLDNIFKPACLAESLLASIRLNSLWEGLKWLSWLEALNIDRNSGHCTGVRLFFRIFRRASVMRLLTIYRRRYGSWPTYYTNSVTTFWYGRSARARGRRCVANERKTSRLRTYLIVTVEFCTVIDVLIATTDMHHMNVLSYFLRINVIIYTKWTCAFAIP